MMLLLLMDTPRTQIQPAALPFTFATLSPHTHTYTHDNTPRQQAFVLNMFTPTSTLAVHALSNSFLDNFPAI